MGLLTQGIPLEWPDIRQYIDIVKERGIKGFLQIYNQYKNHQHDYLKWGDEIEFNLIRFDHKNKKVYLLLKASALLPVLQEAQKQHDLCVKTHWSPEFANYMVEGTPSKPYGDEISDFLKLEENIRLRRRQIKDLLDENEYAFSLSTFPLLGCENFTYPNYSPTPNEGYMKSIFYPDQAINMSNPRFCYIAKNIRLRRNSKVVINVPIYFDKNTPKPFKEDLSRYTKNEKILFQKDNHIYMDSTGFGMGCSCLQTTFQAQSIDEARHLYDQLTPLTPIMLALSAASPIWRGYLSDIDSRWCVISQSVDDRTDEEMGAKPLKESKYCIGKSRYDTTDLYLSPDGEKYNDKCLVINHEAYQTLINNGIDDQLARHISHLFIRDPVCLFKEKLIDNEQNNIDCFENIQSTNWQSMRFKPPPDHSPIGWRVEFRPIDLQITDFENSAFVTFLVLLTRVILTFKLNLLIPISKVDENMKNAQKREACCSEKFYFRNNIFHSKHSHDSQYKSKHNISLDNNENEKDIDSVYSLMTINEIINGNDRFPGLIPLIKEYLSNLNVDFETMNRINEYLKLIGTRASGKLMTAASYMRKFVKEHPKYNHDSHVTDEIAYDLLWRIKLISNSEIKCPEMFY